MITEQKRAHECNLTSIKKSAAIGMTTYRKQIHPYDRQNMVGMNLLSSRPIAW